MSQTSWPASPNLDNLLWHDILRQSLQARGRFPCTSIHTYGVGGHRIISWEVASVNPCVHIQSTALAYHLGDHLCVLQLLLREITFSSVCSACSLANLPDLNGSGSFAYDLASCSFHQLLRVQPTDPNHEALMPSHSCLQGCQNLTVPELMHTHSKRLNKEKLMPLVFRGFQNLFNPKRTMESHEHAVLDSTLNSETVPSPREGVFGDDGEACQDGGRNPLWQLGRNGCVQKCGLWYTQNPLLDHHVRH